MLGWSDASLTWFYQVLKSLSVVETFLITKSYIFPIKEMSNIFEIVRGTLFKECCECFFNFPFMTVWGTLTSLRILSSPLILFNSVVLDSVHGRQVLQSLFKKVTKTPVYFLEIANSVVGSSWKIKKKLCFSLGTECHANLKTLWDQGKIRNTFSCQFTLFYGKNIL